MLLDYWILAIILIALFGAKSNLHRFNPEIKRACLTLGKMIRYVFHCFSGVQPRFLCDIFVDPVCIRPNERISEGNVAILGIITIIGIIRTIRIIRIIAKIAIMLII